MDPERGTDCDEGKTLKGEAHGRSDAQASGGSEVTAAKGVAKPRTWRRGGGGIRCRQTYPPARDCVVGQQESTRGSVVRPAGQPAGRHGSPVVNSAGERKSKEGRPKLRLRDGASVECPRGDERRTGRVEPMPTLDRRARVLEGPRNSTRVRGGRRKAARAATRSLNTLEDRGGPVDRLLRQASFARSVGNHASGLSTDERTRSPIASRMAPVPGSRPGICCCAMTEGHGSSDSTQV